MTLYSIIFYSIPLYYIIYYVMSYCIILIYFVYIYIYTHVCAYIHRLYSTHTRLHLSIVSCLSVDQRYTPNPPSCRGGLNCSPSYVLPGKAPRISLMFGHCTIQNLQATVQVEQEEYQPAPCSTPKPTTARSLQVTLEQFNCLIHGSKTFVDFHTYKKQQQDAVRLRVDGWTQIWTVAGSTLGTPKLGKIGGLLLSLANTLDTLTLQTKLKQR